MDTADLRPLLGSLELEIDDIEEALEPLLQSSLSASASKLPLLDKAKLYVLVTYAVESLLFSYLRLNGTNAKEHPIFTELTRTRQYFQKISQIESAPVQRTQSLDKQAAIRFIKHGLSGNDSYDKERGQQQAMEKAMAHFKLEQLGRGREAEELAENSTNSSDAGSSEQQMPKSGREKNKRQTTTAEAVDNGLQGKKKDRKTKDDDETEDQARPAKRKRIRGEKNLDDTVLPKKKKSSKVPLGHGEAFQALLKGPLPKNEDGSSGKGAKRSKKGES